MSEKNKINDKYVDELILSFFNLESKDIQIDKKDFLDLLKHSLSLNTMEKKRVIDAIPTLSQFQFDELKKVFEDERIKFKDLAKQHPEDIKKLVAKQQKEWLDLGELYLSEAENKKQQNQDNDKINDIKSGLGL